MGAERWVLIKSVKEAQKAKAFLAPVTPEFVIDDVAYWIEWTSPRKLEVGYRHGYPNSILAAIVCREIARRFGVTRIGGDSVGWYSDKDWQIVDEHSPTATYGPHASWAEWVKNYKLEWDQGIAAFFPNLAAQEAAIVARFDQLGKQDI